MEELIEKKIYQGESLKIIKGENYKIVVSQPREIQILSATDDGNEKNDLKITVKSEDKFKRYLYKEKGIELTPEVALPKNKKFSIIIPKSAPEPVINLFPYKKKSNIQFPLKNFINTSNDDPVRMFVLEPNVFKNTAPLQFDEDISYLDGLNFRPVDDDDETVLFSQQLENNINVADGAVDIDNLDENVCKEIMIQLLGKDYEKQLDETKVSLKEKNEFWSIKRGISTSATTGRTLWNHRRILHDFGFKGKFYIKTVKGKQYVIFRGYSGLRKWYTGTRYRATNPKVVNLGSVGKLKSGLKGNAVTILIVGAIDVVEWMLDDSENKQVEDLCVTLGMDILKTVIGSIITAGIVAAVLGAVVLLAGCTAPVWGVIIGGAFLSVGVGSALDIIDNKIGVTNYLKNHESDAGSFLGDNWNLLLESIGRMYYQLEKSIENMYMTGIEFKY